VLGFLMLFFANF
jgi:uncharacterized membrane protein YbaN (DUF454 family)